LLGDGSGLVQEPGPIGRRVQHAMRSAAAQKQLWNELSDLFAEDDGCGSLPEIRLTGASNEGVERAYAALLQRAEPLEADDGVGDGTLDVVLSGIHSCEVSLPDLGVSVFPGGVALDYRMGDEWNAQVVAAFVELLDDLRELAGGGELVAADELDPLDADTQQRFTQAIRCYLDESPTPT
jgi:hypothetical protein